LPNLDLLSRTGVYFHGALISSFTPTRVCFMVAQFESSSLASSRTFPHVIEGLIQVVTGPQRSFFTNVMAQALRIAGQGNSVLVVQFLKGGIGQGADHPTQLGQNLDWLRCNLPRCIQSPDITEEEAIALRDLWNHTRAVVSQGQYSLVVLDELSLAIQFGLIPESEVLELLAQRPTQVDVILTGPDMPSALLDIADQVTELRRTYCA
jgi:cob(I)alamin adenosyltransferase